MLIAAIYSAGAIATLAAEVNHLHTEGELNGANMPGAFVAAAIWPALVVLAVANVVLEMWAANRKG